MSPNSTTGKITTNSRRLNQFQPISVKIRLGQTIEKTFGLLLMFQSINYQKAFNWSTSLSTVGFPISMRHIK